jgi:hypothetical protein
MLIVDQLVPLEHRDDDDRTSAGNVDHGYHRRISLLIWRFRPNVCDVHDLFCPSDAAKTALGMRMNDLAPMRGESGRHVVQRSELVSIPIVEIQRTELGFAKARRVRQHGLENGRERAGRVADDPKDFRSCRLLLQSFGKIERALAQLAEQSRILDRDHRLIRETLQQSQLHLVERPQLVAIDHQGADGTACAPQRRADHCPNAGGARDGWTGQIRKLGIGIVEIANLDLPVLANDHGR